MAGVIAGAPMAVVVEGVISQVSKGISERARDVLGGLVVVRLECMHPLLDGDAVFVGSWLPIIGFDG